MTTKRTTRKALSRFASNAQREAILVIAILLAGVVIYLQAPQFMTADNLVTVLKNSVDLAVISAGMTLVIVMGGIDVSVGGILAVSAIFIGRAFQADLPVVAVIVIGLGIGAALGTLNGVVISRFNVPPIIATLGTMYIWLAVLYIVIGGRWISGLPDTLSPLIRGHLLGVPAVFYVLFIVYGACWFSLRQLPYGKHIFALGSDEAAARLSGVSVNRVKILTYALIGLLAGFAALLYVARLQNVEINIGTTIALNAIAATVLGGANIQGGEGSLLGTLLGVLFIKMMQNGLVLMGVSSLWEQVIIGGLLLVVLAFDMLQRQTRKAYA